MFKFYWKCRLNKIQNELVMKTVAQQRAKVETYNLLRQYNLPIPPDLKREIEEVRVGFAPSTPDTGVSHTRKPTTKNTGKVKREPLV